MLNNTIIKIFAGDQTKIQDTCLIKTGVYTNKTKLHNAHNKNV